MKTYAIRGARTKITGHLRQDGTRTTYCNRPVGIPNGDFTGLKGWKMCTPCAKAEARDRTHAEEVAAQHTTQAAAPTRDEPSDWWTITDPATGEEIVRVYGETYQEMTPRAEALPEVRAVIRAHKGFSRRRLYTSELTPEQAAEQAASTAPHPIETYYTLDCNNHGATCDANPAQRHDYRHSVISHEDRAQIAAGTVPPWCYSTADDRPAADAESRQAAELITEAEATDGTWRAQWIGDATALFDRPIEQGALFA